MIMINSSEDEFDFSLLKLFLLTKKLTIERKSNDKDRDEVKGGK